MSKWKHFAEQTKALKTKLELTEDKLTFLGYFVNLQTGEILDNLKGEKVADPSEHYVLYTLLTHYAQANPTQKGKLIKFRDLPGGNAYERAFNKRAIAPIAQAFGTHSENLLKAAKLLNGIQKSYGDTAVEIPALPQIPLTYILWKGDEEISASATILFDSSANQYLPTEDLAVLGEVTTKRLTETLKTHNLQQQSNL